MNANGNMHSGGRNLTFSISGKNKKTDGNKTVLKIITDRKKDKSAINDGDIQGKLIEHHAFQAKKKKKKGKNQQAATLEEVSLLMPKLDVKPVPVINQLLMKPKLDRTQPKKVEENLDINDSISNENDESQEKSINQGENHLQPKKKRKKKTDEENSANNEIQNPELESAAENTDMAGTHMTSKESGKKSKNKNKASKNAENIEGKESKSNEEHTTKQKNFVLFLGNLPYDITEAEVEEHFKVVKGSIKRITLLTNPNTGEGRGCGFLELTTSKAYHDALKLNLSQLQDRKINVEFTVPGRKGSKRRSKYIKMKTKKLLGQRKKGKKKGQMGKNAV